MKICFGGDVFLGGDLLGKSCSHVVRSEPYNLADVRIFNLEHPISDSSFVENKSTLYVGSSALNQLKELKVSAVNLAHNHIQDKGLDGIAETVVHLGSVGVGHFGAGENEKSASEPFWLNDDVAVIGYCDFQKPYLSDIAVSDCVTPGVNPLRYEKIKSDLDALPKETKAILYFHWGMEHVWLPPYEDIELAKKILEDERVITIIGMHPHRVQGVIKHAGKKAYMCLGNFIFPNFYIRPPVQIYVPTDDEKKNVRSVTRRYHVVYDLTYKKWRWFNRVSLLISYDTDSGITDHDFVIQDDCSPVIKDLQGLSLNLYKALFFLLTTTYKIPAPMYKLIWKVHAYEVRKVWRFHVKLFQIRQLGFKRFLGKVLEYFRKKIRK